jgi:putative RecB family exonuclease
VSGIEPAPIVVSATLYRTFLTCPQQALGRLQGTYPAETVPGVRGQLAHRIFARHLAGGGIREADFSRACRQEIGSGLNPKLATLGITKPSQLGPIIAEVGDLYARFRRISTEGFRAAEVSLEVEMAPGVVLRGVIDAIFDDPDVGTRIVDWKTGPSLAEAVAQLEFYCLAWWLDRGELPGRAEAVSVATGERFCLTPRPPDVAATARTVAALAAAARAAFASGGDLERRGGPHCRYCPLVGECREGAAAVRVLAAG